MTSTQSEPRRRRRRSRPPATSSTSTAATCAPRWAVDPRLRRGAADGARAARRRQDAQPLKPYLNGARTATSPTASSRCPAMSAASRRWPGSSGSAPSTTTRPRAGSSAPARDRAQRPRDALPARDHGGRRDQRHAHGRRRRSRPSTLRARASRGRARRLRLHRPPARAGAAGVVPVDRASPLRPRRRGRAGAGGGADASTAPVALPVCDYAEEAVRGAELVVPCTVADAPTSRSTGCRRGRSSATSRSWTSSPTCSCRSTSSSSTTGTSATARGRRSTSSCSTAASARGPARRAGRRRAGEHRAGDPDERILLNPMGMAIEDVACAAAVYRTAREQGAGTWLTLA